MVALPPLVVAAASFAYGIDVAAWLVHFATFLCAVTALGMAVRLRWSPDGVMLSARSLLWTGIGGACGVAWSFVFVLVKEHGSIDYAITSYGLLCVFTATVALGASLVLSVMIRRAASGRTRPRPWTTFA